MITDSEKNSTLSEKTSLFQALRVLQEDEDSEALKTTLEPNESVCMKTGAFTAMIGTQFYYAYKLIHFITFTFLKTVNFGLYCCSIC